MARRYGPNQAERPVTEPNFYENRGEVFRYSGRGVIRSLPCASEYAKKPGVTQRG